MDQEWIKISQYDAIRISEFKGKFAIQKARRTEKDNYIEWIIPTRYDKDAGHSVPAMKKDSDDYINVPLQIPLGEEKNAAANILRALYVQLTGETINNHREAEPEPINREYDGPPVDEDMGSDIPF